MHCSLLTAGRIVSEMLLVTKIRMISWVFSVHLFRICVSLSQDVKTWHPNTNFLNPRNWENGQVPCANDLVIFSDSSPVIIMMPESLAVSGLILPSNGEIIFPENATVELTGGIREGVCTGKDVHFQTTVDYWYDPVNWNITSDRAYPKIPNQHNRAVPHAFQVPCLTDKVQFPENTTFRTHVLHPIPKVSSMDINGVSYTQSEFEDLLNTHVGTMLFPNNPKVEITSSVCTDESGCACGNDGPEMLPTICQEVTPLCPALECSDPITPVGNCCPICGARIIMQRKSNFKMDTLMTLFNNILSKEEYEKVESFTAKTHEGDIQSVFVDNAEYKGLANKAANQIYEILTSVNGPRLFEVRSAAIYKSEAWNSDVPTYDSLSRGMSSGGVAAIVIVLIATLGLGAAFYVYKKRHIPGFNFARFDLRGDKIEMELGTTPHDELQPVDPAEAASSSKDKSKSFDNPVYGTAVEDVSSAAEEVSESRDFVENPMFMIFEDSFKPNNGEEDQE